MKYLIILTLTLAFMLKLVSCTEHQPEIDWPEDMIVNRDSIPLIFPAVDMDTCVMVQYEEGAAIIRTSVEAIRMGDSIVTSGVLEWNADTVMGTWHVTDSGLFIISFDSIAIK